MDTSLYIKQRPLVLEGDKLSSVNHFDSKKLNSKWDAELKQSLIANDKIVSKDVSGIQPNVDRNVQDQDKENISFVQEKRLENISIETVFPQGNVSRDISLTSVNIDAINENALEILNDIIKDGLTSSEDQKSFKNALSIEREIPLNEKTLFGTQEILEDELLSNTNHPLTGKGPSTVENLSKNKTLTEKTIVGTQEMIEDKPLSISNRFVTDKDPSIVETLSKDKTFKDSENVKDKDDSLLSFQTRELKISGEKQQKDLVHSVPIEGKEDQDDESAEKVSLGLKSDVLKQQGDANPLIYPSQDLNESTEEKSEKLAPLQEKRKTFLHPQPLLYQVSLKRDNPSLDLMEKLNPVSINSKVTANDVSELNKVAQMLISSENVSLEDSKIIAASSNLEKSILKALGSNERSIPKMETMKISKEILAVLDQTENSLSKPILLNLDNGFALTEEKLTPKIQSSPMILNEVSNEQEMLNENKVTDDLQYPIVSLKQQILNQEKILNEGTEFFVMKEDVSHKITDHLNAMILKGKNSEITLTMEPPETGKIIVKLQFEGEKVQAEILSSHSEFLKDIERTRSDLIYRLQEKDIVLDKFEVRLTESNAHFNDQRSQGNKENPLLQREEFERVVRMRTINNHIEKVENFNDKKINYVINKGIDRVF